MSTQICDTDSLTSLFHLIRLRGGAAGGAADGSDTSRKIEQIKAYLTLIDAALRGVSRKRTLTFVESAAGNCYLSFLVYYEYAVHRGLDMEIHCIDSNGRLIENASRTATTLGFAGMHFHHCDILGPTPMTRADVTYTLHACDAATDKALFLGMSLNASTILSVACCQHGPLRSFHNHGLKGMTRYKAFRERLVYMVADTMRANLLARNGYRVDVFDFTSSRNTDKNTMLRARRTNRVASERLRDEYDSLRTRFRFEPELARLLDGTGSRRGTRETEST